MLRAIPRYRAIRFLLAIVFASQAIVANPAQARMLGTGTVLGSQQTDQRSAIRAVLAKDQVRNALRAYGVAPDEAMARVAALSDGEVAMLAAQIEDDPAGQGLLGVVVLAGLVALIVLIVADATGKADVF